MTKERPADRLCRYDDCTNNAYIRYHSGWDKWIHSTTCKSCDANMKKYSITTPMRNEMYTLQKGQCATCYMPVEFQGGKSLSPDGATVDHCHKTDDVRGILCGHCNNILGRAKDSVEILRNCADYLELNYQDYIKRIP